MEFINRIELQGLVGKVSLHKVGDQICARFSVCTETTYQGEDGSIVVECTWLNCTAWSGKCPQVTELQQRESKVHIIGRIRSSRYMTANDEERTILEVFANYLKIIND